jgi:hypothetical protein
MEGPVHKDVVIERIRQCYKMGRIRGSARDNVEQAIRSAQSSNIVRGDGTFIWLQDDQLRRPPRVPVDGNIEHAPPNELKAVTVAVAGAMFGIPRPDLIVEVARRLGFNRTGGRISEVIEKVVQEFLTEGFLLESFGMVHIQANEPKGEFNSSRNPTVETAEKGAGPNKEPDSGKLATPRAKETLRGGVDAQPESTSLVDRLRARGLEVIDKRPSGGVLWVVGGPELKSVLQQFERGGARFTFASGGGQVTKKRPAWWTRAPGGL